MSQRPATLLGFDHGEKKIGIAVGQGVTGTASPLLVLPVRQRRPDWSAISKLIETWEPDALVVGLPLDRDGSEQPASRAARLFRDQLAGRFGIPVHMIDERYSTLEARQRLSERGTPLAEDDAVAAQIILESWLQEKATGC